MNLNLSWNFGSSYDGAAKILCDFYCNTQALWYCQPVNKMNKMNKAAQALGRLGGLAKSAAKTRAVRENAKLGGWPKGRKRKKARKV